MSFNSNFKCVGKNKPFNININKNNHQVFLYCEYCNQGFIENIFKITRQSELVWKLIHMRNPISQHLEPKICCNSCYSIKMNTIQSNQEPVNYQILPTRELKKIIPKL